MYAILSASITSMIQTCVASQFEFQQYECNTSWSPVSPPLLQECLMVYEYHIYYSQTCLLPLDTLASRRAKTMTKITYCCIHNQQPMYLLDQLKQVTHIGLPTRSTDANVLQVPRVKGNYGQMGYSYRGPMQWNITCVEFKAAVNVIPITECSISTKCPSLFVVNCKSIRYR